MKKLILVLSLLLVSVPVLGNLGGYEGQIQALEARVERSWLAADAVDFDLAQERLAQANQFLADARFREEIGDTFELMWLLPSVENRLAETERILFPARRVEARILSLDAGSFTRLYQTGRLASMVAQTAKAGFNTIYVEVLRDDGYTMYPSKWTVQSPLFEGQDPLAELVDLAHEHGLSIYPWLKIFFGSADHTLGPVLSQHPEWAAVDYEGNNLTTYGLSWFNPAHPGARDFLINSIMELIENYAFNGLQIDYIRYPNSLHAANQYSYDDYSVEAFKSIYGVDPREIPLPPESMLVAPTTVRGQFGQAWEEWQSWREEQVNSFLGRLVREANQQQPGIPVSVGMAVALWGGGTIQYPLFTRQQNWRTWVDRHLVGSLSPMFYTDSNSTVEREANILKGLAGPRVYINPSLGVDFVKAPIQIVQQIQLTRDAGFHGVRIFAHTHMTNDDWRMLETGPFRVPALSPVKAPWTAVEILLEEMQARWDRAVERELLSVQSRQTLVEGLNRMERILRGVTDLAFRTQAQRANAMVGQLNQLENTVNQQEMGDPLRQAIRSDIRYLRDILEIQQYHWSTR